MNFFTKTTKLTKLPILLMLSFLPFLGNAQTCPANGPSYAWPTHSKWFFGNGVIGDFSSGASFSTVTGAPAITSYEGTAAVADQNGNLLWFTNGRRVWDPSGNLIHDNLTTGNEDVRVNGSAVQGVIVVRHPLDPDVYHVFCTDDVISNGNMGLDYFTLDKGGNVITGPTTIAAGRSFEGITATMHGNGVDVWVMAQDFATGNYNAYLIDCSGLNIAASNLNQDMGISFEGNKNYTRGALEFSWDGTMLGQAHPAAWPVGDQEISIIDFDNLTGTLSNPIHFSNTMDTYEMYDLEFSADNQRLYFTTKFGRVGYFDISSGVGATITGTRTTIATLGGGGESGLETAADGRIYVNNFNESNLHVINGAGTGVDPVNVGSDLAVTLGLPNIYLPPRDWVEIQDPSPVDECALPIDLETLWLCKGTSAENTPRYEAAYSVEPGEGTTINDTTGLFTAPGAGTYTVYFEICEIKDTLTFTIDPCGCEADVDGTASICAGETVNLDDFIVDASGVNEWTIDSVPTSAGVDPTIDDSGVDTLFDASALNTKPGIYKLKFTVDNSCEDSLYIEVKKIPEPSITPFGPLCIDSVTTNMIATPVLGGDVTAAAFAINSTPILNNEFDPAALGAGDHEVIYGVDSLGCLAADTIEVTVLERPNPQITQVGPYCANDPSVNLVITPASADTGVWAGEVDALGAFNPSNAGAGDHDVFYYIYGQCGNGDTISIHVDAVKDATIATPDSIVCESEPAINLTTGDLSGTWYVNDTLNGSELGGTAFDPSTYGPGVYDLIYHLSDPCGDLDTIEITVLPNADATVFNGDTALCKDESAFTLNTLNTGGTWFKGDTLAGSELGTASLDPANHDGVFNLYYYFSGRCGDVDSLEVTINPLKDATINTAADSMSYCILDPNPTFTVNEAGGTWNNAAVNQNGTNIEIDLAALGIVNDEMLIYTQADPCGDMDTIWVTTTNQLDATITQVGPFCDDADSVKLQVVDAGGTFSGTGVDPNTGWFDPVEAGDGVHRITYTIPGNCGDNDFIDITVNRTPDPTITNANFDFCEDHGDEALTVAEAGGTWSDIDNTNGGLDGANSIFNTVTSGDGSFRMQYGFGGACPAYDTVTFNITALPVVSIADEDTLCEDNATVNLVGAASPSTSTTWGGAATVAGEFDPSGNVGDNQIIYSAMNGNCPAADTINIHVLPRADASIDQVGPYCVSGGNTLLSPSSNNDVWSGMGITDADLGIFSPSTAGAGIHTITRTISGRCGDQQTVDIQVDGAPDVSFNLPPQVCAGSGVIQFTPNVPGGTWSGDLNADGTFDPVAGGTYIAVYNRSELCNATDTMEFVVDSVPNTLLEATPRSGCVPLDVVFNDISEEVAVTSSWDFGNSLTSSDLGSASTTYQSVGCYDVTLTNTYPNGCSSEYTLEDAVCTFDNPNANFTWNPTTLDVDNNQAAFSNASSSDVVAFNWDFTDVALPAQSDPITTPSIATSTDENPTVVFNSANGDVVNVQLIVANSNGCRDTVVKPITIIDKFSVFIPNAFTPNGDGFNDTFFPVGRNLEFGENYEFRIYNRWGTLIWMSEVPYEGWDGTVTELSPSSGEQAQIDVYVWRLEVRDPFTGDNEVMVGRVSLIK